MAQNSNNENLVDIREVLIFFVSKWKFIVKITSIFVVLGLIVAFGTTPQFSASSKVISTADSEKSSLGNLSSLAGLAGINLDVSSGGGISPILYAEVVNSLPFMVSLLNEEIYFTEEDSTLTSFDYFKNIYDPGIGDFLYKYTIGLPRQLINLIKPKAEEVVNPQFEKGIYSFSKDEFEIIEAFRERIKVEINIESGSIMIFTTMPDPRATAELNKVTLQKLQKVIIDYRVSKAKEDLKFTEERYKEVEMDYNKKQRVLAEFISSNRNVVSEQMKFELQNVRNDYQLSYDLLSLFQKQLEQNKLAVMEATPIFQIINPPSIPVEKSEPKRSVILILFTFFGGLFVLAYLFIRKFYLLENF